MTIRLVDAARWDRQLPHQMAAWQWLQEQLTPQQLAEFAVLYRAGPASSQVQPLPRNPLVAVPYFPQLDNGPEGYRQCQTSAIAMILSYLQVPGIHDDLDYLKVVNRYGDTTRQQAHQLALRALDVRARFVQNMTVAQAQAEIRAGLPVAMGILHRGPVTAPSGGGHWIVAYGFTDKAWIVHDPYGELDLVNGGWTAQGGLHGMQQAYSFKNTNPRWLIEGPASGWAWVFS